MPTWNLGCRVLLRDQHVGKTRSRIGCRKRLKWPQPTWWEAVACLQSQCPALCESCWASVTWCGFLPEQQKRCDLWEAALQLRQTLWELAGWQFCPERDLSSWPPSTTGLHVYPLSCLRRGYSYHSCFVNQEAEALRSCTNFPCLSS